MRVALGANGGIAQKDCGADGEDFAFAVGSGGAAGEWGVDGDGDSDGEGLRLRISLVWRRAERSATVVSRRSFHYPRHLKATSARNFPNELSETAHSGAVTVT